MGKIWVEVSLISARGLRRSSSLWKLQWFAVGWIDPNNKYCTKIDTSGNANPVWKTKFAALVDDTNFQDMSLHVQVYSREPFFLRERLHGTATIALKEFLAKYSSNSQSQASRPRTEEVASYQLRKGNSSKPQGFVDISIHMSEEREEPSSYAGNDGGLVLVDRHNNISLSPSSGSGNAYSTELSVAPPRQPLNQSSNFTYAHSNPSTGGPIYQPGDGYNYRPPQTPTPPPPPQTPTPPPPPPPSNIGYMPTFLPNADYINMPSSVAAPAHGRTPRPGLAMGLGAGALAAGAVIFGDDFMSGFNIPTEMPDPSLTISTNPPL